MVATIPRRKEVSWQLSDSDQTARRIWADVAMLAARLAAGESYIELVDCARVARA